MKNKLLFLSLFVSAFMMLCACSEGDGGKDTSAESVEYPENGVYYEYSEGGNSDRITGSITFEEGREISRNEYDYWTDGKLKSITTTVDGEATDIWNYIYDTDGLLLQMVRQYTEDGYKCKDDYRYNKDGNIEELLWFESDEYAGGFRYSYNDNGDITLKEQLDANKEVIIYTEYTFTEDNKTESSKEYMYGSLVSYSDYEYNDAGLLIRISNHSSDGELVTTVKNEYDGEGNLIKILNCAPDGTVTSYTECLYNDEGFNYRDIYYEDGKPVYSYDYTEDGARVYSSYN